MTTKIQTIIKNAKFRLMIRLLKWYGSEDMDQWDLFKLDIPHGKLYVALSLEPLETFKDNHFREIKCSPKSK